MEKGRFPLPRGIRNNNPGNIRLSAARWRGQKAVQTDPDFVEFETPVMGLRALMLLLLTYYRRHGLDTVEGILNRYAPPAENATWHYVRDVSGRMGVGRRQRLRLDDPETLSALARAIVGHENGRAPRAWGGGEWYGADLYKQAAQAALSRE